MTRRRLNRALRRVYTLIGLILIVALISKLARHIPGLDTGWPRTLADDIYAFLKDMTLLLVTIAAAYLTNVFQKRRTFVERLRGEWRNIVSAKSALTVYCEKAFPTTDDYVTAYCRISETIDNMRVVYRNVGETRTLIGKYPYVPLHDMRRAFETLDPRTQSKVSIEDKGRVADAVQQSFQALRENFLDELDLDEPTHPILISAARRLKTTGSSYRAQRQTKTAERYYQSTASPRPDIDRFLSDLHYRELADDYARERGRRNEKPTDTEPES